MTALVLPGLNGSSPLGFMGALGLLRVLAAGGLRARLAFVTDGSFQATFEGVEGHDLPTLVDQDAAMPCGERPWWLAYEKQEKRGAKTVADLKPPPGEFRRLLDRCLGGWSRGDDEAAAYAAAFATDVAVDGKGNTKPTAFHFTAANQQFLTAIEGIRASVTREWAARSLFEGWAERPGQNVRWSPAAERNWALRATNPEKDETTVDAPLEWLAFRGLALFPAVPRGRRIATTCVHGRGDEMRFVWPLWSVGASLETVRSLLQAGWDDSPDGRRLRGVFAVCSSAIRRTSQGFGNFGPASVSD